jgi:hypothetical protein
MKGGSTSGSTLIINNGFVITSGDRWSSISRTLTGIRKNLLKKCIVNYVSNLSPYGLLNINLNLNSESEFRIWIQNLNCEFSINHYDLSSIWFLTLIAYYDFWITSTIGVSWGRCGWGLKGGLPTLPYGYWTPASGKWLKLGWRNLGWRNGCRNRVRGIISP